ncbi:MAG: lamin tail domain-containing protein [Patescibacteria group bacterium]
MPQRGHFRRLVGRALIVAVGIIPLLHPLQARSASPLVIGEVAWAGSSLSLADEWVELWNLGDTDVPLAGYSLVGASAEPIALPSDAVIPARGVYLVSNYPADDPRSALAATPQLVTTAVSLSNSALSITLIDPNDTELDRAGDGGTPPAGATGDMKATMVRDGDMWTTATSSIGFDAGAPDLGTPGMCDGCDAVVDDPPVGVDTPPTDVIASSTEPIPTEDSYATTSLDVPPTDTTDVASSTGDVFPVTTTEPIPTSATTTVEVVIETATNTTTNNPTSTQVVPTVETSPRYDLLRLNEVQAQPDGEGEWIEITSLDLSMPIPLVGVQIHDATGRIFTFASGTIDLTTPFVRAGLASSRLNNGGDTISLHDPDGNAVDTLVYEGSEKGFPWARDEDAVGAWRLTQIPTPGEPNVIADLEDDEESSIETDENPPITTFASVVKVPQASATVSLPVSAPMSTPRNAPPATETKVKATVAKSTSAKVTKTTAKTATSTTLQPTPITIAMTTNDTYRGIRVTLQGTVGSPSGLLTGHGFVLLAPDGRGLLVRVPTAKKLPALGEMVQVTGTLQFDDLDTPSLKLGTKDGWTVLTGLSIQVTTRTVDLLAPGDEDRWSLVAATGDVVRIQSGNVTIRVDGSDVVVAIKKAVDYRASRLTAGDTIRVTGLLDLSQDTPRIVPRTAEEIELVGHAAPASVASAVKDALPGWTPFGAAGLAIAGTEGVKQLRERRKRKSLERMLETCSDDAQKDDVVCG